MRVTLELGRFGWDYVLRADDGRTVHIGTDWDYPSIASNLGWRPCDKCRATDGTVDCEHKTASEMIAEAHDFLDEHEGESFEDPGYFDGEN